MNPNLQVINFPSPIKLELTRSIETIRKNWRRDSIAVGKRCGGGVRMWRRVAVTSQGQTEWPPCVAAADRCVALATTAPRPGGGCVAAGRPERQSLVDESQATRSRRRISQLFILKMASTSSLFPDELIIRHVRNHSCLYDPRETEYKDADRKAAVWREIANAVGMSGK